MGASLRGDGRTTYWSVRQKSPNVAGTRSNSHATARPKTDGVDRGGSQPWVMQDVRDGDARLGVGGQHLPNQVLEC
jgi:hypothetical protein